MVKSIIAKRFGAKDMIDPFGFSFLNGLVSTDRHMALLSSRLPAETASWVYGTTPPFNFTGQPSLSLPLWQSEENLPLGMMFTGQFGDEATLYRLAGQLEKELPWAGRKPPIWG
jgi:Asp-tRNA(Asn)/Glu-tRNA(Gln) amidotransferase A subunit family amidase